MALKPGDGLSHWEIATTRKLVNELRRRHRLLDRQEFDDLVQDCLLHWITVRDKISHDPDKPLVGYMAQVLRNKLTDWVRELGAEKRAGDLRMESLDASVDGTEDGLTLAETLDLSDQVPSVRESEASYVVRIDMGRALDRLSPAQRRLCRMLGEEGLSMKVASEQLGIPRGTLYEELKRIRVIFEGYGLQDYLRD